MSAYLTRADLRAAASSSTGQHLDALRRLVHERTGIVLPASKATMIEARLRKRFTDLGLANLQAYLCTIFDGGQLNQELPHIVNALTTNKTDFFREYPHFELLEKRIIPEALARARASSRVRFRLWSAAASTGAEAWSAAMVLASAATAEPRLDWRILGTDISTEVLQTASTAIYSAVDVAPVTEGHRAAYLMCNGNRARRLCRIRPELRSRVRFRKMNLVETPYPVEGGIDTIFLRNVLIYFEPQMQARIVGACAEKIRPGGYLIVGHSESMIVKEPGLAQIAPGVFRQEGGQ
ncbi:CheR family methyltransferase [Pseudoroseicyclus tamaricis]|uniref:Chemotaxis protein methyltransferase n=1 Tax=Pseudoroseicyclus tamaricis TaxID=2705421 RepID=A0A6B2JQS1_9RHOB|nr:CheR family methyltransferase [Pseudoroseicyclus tamaricis]NDV00315.1 chemotaxis protein CheR [Pseudoroseicyclus tamaricis]